MHIERKTFFAFLVFIIIILIAVSITTIKFEEKITCSDTDGINYYKTGYVNISNETDYYFDYCNSATEGQLVEYYCLDGMVGKKIYNCPDGCNESKCIRVCVDSDSGVDYNISGTVRISDIGNYTDYCSNNTLIEYYCNGSELLNTTHECEVLCGNGSCLICYDSDGGKDYYTAGEVKQNIGIVKDYCNDSVLVEFYCSNDNLSSELYDCINGCENGSCINVSDFCNDTDSGLDYSNNGTVQTETGYYQDKCLDSTKLEEKHCVGSNVNSSCFVCSDYMNKCENSKCVFVNTSVTFDFNTTNSTSFFYSNTIHEMELMGISSSDMTALIKLDNDSRSVSTDNIVNIEGNLSYRVDYIGILPNNVTVFIYEK